MKLTAIFITLLTLTGCATHPPQTRAEWLATTTRTYPHHSPEQILTAAEEILRRRGGKRFKIAHDPSGFKATFNWIFLTASGVDHWRIDAVRDANGATATAVAVARAGNVMVATANGAGGVNTQTLPTGSNPIQGTALYDLWYARMDHLLTGEGEYRKCQVQQERMRSEPEIWGGLKTLCL